MNYKIIIPREVKKDVRKFPLSLLRRINRKIFELENNPFPPDSIKLAGDLNLYRIRVGDYRVIYSVETVVKIIEIKRIAHRRQVYNQL